MCGSEQYDCVKNAHLLHSHPVNFAVRSLCAVTDVLTVDPKVERIQLLRTPYSSLQNALGIEMGFW